MTTPQRHNALHVDAEALPAGSERGESALEDGQHVSAETSRRLACDAAKVDMRLRLCDAHHVEHSADGGATKLDNLVQLCRRHHRAVHEEGFTVELHEGGAARFRKPDGRAIEEAPALPRVEDDAVAALARRLGEREIEVDAAESLPSWAGGRVEIGWAVEWMREAGAP